METMDRVNMEGLSLFFNNETITYGYDQLRAGMTRAEAQQALEAAGFEPLLARAFLQKLKRNVNVWFKGGRMHLANGGE